MSDLNQDDLIITAVNVTNNTISNDVIVNSETINIDSTTLPSLKIDATVEHCEFNFVPFKNEGLELIVNTTTGLAYASKRATARMLQVDEKTIRNAAAKYKVIKAQIQTPGGLQGADLLSADIVFDLAFKYSPQLARKMGTIGANLYMLNLAGFKIKLEEAKPAPVNLSNRDLALMVIAEADRADALVAQIEQDKPCTDLGKAIIKSDNNIRIGEFAKSLGLGQNRYFTELRECKIIMSTSTLPYQRFCSEGYFVVTQTVANNKTFPVSLITPKGQAYLVKRHQQYIQRGITEDSMESILPSIV